ncbi:MAG: flippase, partial [DPANN group archaeon]|nr:flippase [DPANN group archaeon]
MDYTKKVLRGAGIVFVSLLLTGFLSYLVRLILARNLSVVNFGLFFAVFALIDTLLSYRNLGLGAAVGKFIPEFLIKKDYASIKNIMGYYAFVQLFFYLVIAGILVALAPWLAEHYFHDERAVLLIYALLVSLLFSLPDYVFQTFFVGYQRIKVYAVANIAKTTTLLLTLYVFFSYSPSLMLVALAYLLSFVVSSILYLWNFFSSYVHIWKASFTYNPQLFKRLFVFGLPIFFGIIASTLITKIDTLTLTYFRSLEEVGLYNVALPIATLLLFISKAISIVLMPITSELKALKHKGFAPALGKLILFLFMTLLPLSLILFLFPSLIITLLFGTNYLAAAPALKILSVAAVLYAFGNTFVEILVGIGK